MTHKNTTATRMPKEILDQQKLNYVDLGLPSGTLWADQNSEGYYTFDEAVAKFGDMLPKAAQMVELWEECSYEWDDGRKGMVFTGPNGNSIFLPAVGFRSRTSGAVLSVGVGGGYWSACSYVGGGYRDGRLLYFNATYVNPVNGWDRASGYAVRCVRKGGGA